MSQPPTQPLLSTVHLPPPPPPRALAKTPAVQPARQVVYVMQSPRAVAARRAGAVCPMCQGTRWKNRRQMQLGWFLFGLVLLYYCGVALLGVTIMGLFDGIQRGEPGPVIAGCVALLLLLAIFAIGNQCRHYRQCRGCGYRYQTK